MIDEGVRVELFKAGNFIQDPFYVLFRELRDGHRMARTGIYKKYGLYLGMEDPEVQHILRGARADHRTAFVRDSWTGMKWMAPALMNAWCCMCKDMTHLEEKIYSGDAYEVGCCSWNLFFKDPTTPVIKTPRYGRNEELVIILSCPGDPHTKSTQWPEPMNLPQCAGMERTADGPAGDVHSRFLTFSLDSDGKVMFCPVQLRDGPEASVKQRLVTEVDRLSVEQLQTELGIKLERPLSLWKAYWLANIKRALAHSTMAHDVNTVKFVAILGGGEGSRQERAQISNMLLLLENRQKIQDIVNKGIDSVMCCITCGAAQSMCLGCTSGIHMVKLLYSRLGFCTPIKNEQMAVSYVLADAMEQYLRREMDVLEGWTPQQLMELEGFLPGLQAITVRPGDERSTAVEVPLQQDQVVTYRL